MKHYLDLIPLSARIHSRQSRMTRICIILAVFLVSVMFGLADMYLQGSAAKGNAGKRQLALSAFRRRCGYRFPDRRPP